MSDLDWKDIAIHGAIGAAVGLAAVFISGWLLLANALFWIGREAVQRVRKVQPMSRLVTEPQVVLEWALPTVLAPLIFAVF